MLRETRLSNQGGGGCAQTPRPSVSVSQADRKLTNHVSVGDHENFELAARQSKCPKTKIHFQMLLFRIFIHRSSLIFHSINAFTSHLFSSPLGALHIQMNRSRFTPGSALSLNSWPLTLALPPPTCSASCSLGPSQSPIHSPMLPTLSLTHMSPLVLP